MSPLRIEALEIKEDIAVLELIYPGSAFFGKVNWVIKQIIGEKTLNIAAGSSGDDFAGGRLELPLPEGVKLEKDSAYLVEIHGNEFSATVPMILELEVEAPKKPEVQTVEIVDVRVSEKVISIDFKSDGVPASLEAKVFDAGSEVKSSKPVASAKIKDPENEGVFIKLKKPLAPGKYSALLTDGISVSKFDFEVVAAE